MATIVLKNLTSSEIHLSDLGVVIGKSGVTDSTVGRIETVTVTRPAADVQKWLGVAALVADGDLTMTVTLSADEIAAGIAGDVGAVASTDLLSDVVMIRKAFTAGAGGSADDVTIWAAGAVPAKMRVLDVTLLVATNVTSATCTLRTATAGGGSALSTALSANATGTARNAATASAVVATTDAMVIRRSDSGIAGEMLILARREA